MVHAAIATHRPKTARRRVADIVDVLLQYKKHLLVIPAKPEEAETEEKLRKGSIKVKKVKLSLLQAVEAHRTVRRRGSHVF
jgi:hypothetical protein